MRVVNDRRKLPRVALNGGAILYSPRGQFQCACIDVSAGGMAIVAMAIGRVKERVRIHAQLSGFPLLTDALVVRARQVQNGYLWGLRFLRLDRTTKANLEAFVRQQLASAARLRQAQLYAQRLRGLGLAQMQSPAPAFAIEATLEQSAEPTGPGINVPTHWEAPPPPVVATREFDPDTGRHYTPPVAFPAISGSAEDPLLFDPEATHNTQAERMFSSLRGQGPQQPQYEESSQYPPQGQYAQQEQYPYPQQEQYAQQEQYPQQEQAQYQSYDPRTYPESPHPEEHIWEIDESDLEIESETLEVENPRHPTPGYEDELRLEPDDFPAATAPTLGGMSVGSQEGYPEIEPDRPPVLPPALEIVDFDAQEAEAEPESERQRFHGVSEPGLYAGVPSPDLDPDEMPTPPMGTTFPGREEPDLYAADGVRLPTPPSPFDRLADLRRDEDIESPYLGDIQASTSDLTPTDAKMRMTDEVLEAETERFGPAPAPVTVDPTTPVSVWPEERTPPVAGRSRDLASDRSTDIPIHPAEGHRTNPGYAVLPDFDYEPEPDVPGEEPARTGETVVADPRTYQWPPMGADLSGPHQMPDEAQYSEPYAMPTPGQDMSGVHPVAPPPPPEAPGMYAVVPLLDTEQAAVSGFTVVAPDDGLEERSRMSVLPGEPAFDSRAHPPGPDGAMTSMYTPLPEYPEGEDTATTLHNRGGACRGRTISPEEGLRLSMPGAAVAPAAPGAAAPRRSTDLAGAGPGPLPMLNRRPPPPPMSLPSTKHTHIEISRRPAPPPPQEGSGAGLNGSKRVPQTRGSGTVARPQKGNRPGLENATTRAFPVVPPLATDPNVQGAGSRVAPPPASQNTGRRHPTPGGYPLAAQSGGYPVAAQSGQHPAAQSGSYPAAAQSGGYSMAAQSGGYPVAAQSGRHPAVKQSPPSGANGRMPQSLIPTGPHQAVGPAPPSRIPTSPHDVPVGTHSPKSTKRQLVEDALAQLRARTAEKRRIRGDTSEQEEIKHVPRRKKRGVPMGEGGDPQLADLFRAAIKDLERAREE